MVAAAVAVPPAWVITEPSLIDGMPAEIYHSDPVIYGSLSSSGARRLVPPKCPAAFRWGENEPTKAMERGTAAHTVLLGTGAELVVIEGNAVGAWATKETKALVAEAREAGKVPVKPEQHAVIQKMAAALAGHRKAAELFEPGSGRPEQSAFWPDDEFGVWRRCRLDWLRHEPGADDIVRVVDYKTCQSASREAAARSMANYGYHIQAWFNCEAVRYFRPGTDVRFTMVCQETEPPYLVECYEPDADALAEGQYWGQAAMEIFRDCLETGQWPGYNPEQTITSLALPRWGYRDDPW